MHNVIRERSKLKSLGVRTDISQSAEHQTIVDAHFRSHAVEWRDVYEEASVQGAIYRKRLEIVLRWIDELAIPVRKKILEIGCGSGRSAVALAQRGYLVQAIDPVEDMLNSTRRYAAGARVSSSILTSLGDAHTLAAFPESAFGLVLAIGVIPYLHSPEKALKEMARALEPGGFLLVTIANRARLDYALDPWLCPATQGAKRIVRAIMRRFRGPRPGSTRPPLRLSSLRELEGWLSSVGLAKIKAKTVGFQPTFRHRRFFAERFSIRLNCWLQWLADNNVPGIRATGMDYIVLARKEEG